MRTYLELGVLAFSTLLGLGVAVAPARAVEIPANVAPPAAPSAGPALAALQPETPAEQKALIAGRSVGAMPGAHPAGTIVVVNSERKLYFSLGDGKAIVYPVAIGKPGRAFHGSVTVTRKVANPGWTPTPNIRAENPHLPAYVPPGPNNPLGPRALYLSKGFYRIHGTNKPSSIGRAASNGCIRMFNKDVLDLFARVSAGARVVVVQ